SSPSYGNHPAILSFPTRRSSDLNPYLVITGLLVILAVMIQLSKLPEVNESDDTAGVRNPAAEKKSVFQFPQLVFGVVALFFSSRSEEHTSELQSRENLVCRLLLE